MVREIGTRSDILYKIRILRGKTTRTPPKPLEIIGRKEKLKLLGVTFEQVPVIWDTNVDYLLIKAISRLALYIIRICKYYGYSIENLSVNIEEKFVCPGSSLVCS